MDKLHGQGKYTFADGSVYAGDFQRDMRHGHGEMTYINDRTTGLLEPGTTTGATERARSFMPTGACGKENGKETSKMALAYLHLPDGIVRKQRYVNGRLQGS